MKASIRTGGLILVLVLACISNARGDLSPSECNNERRLLVSKCRPVVFGAKPSAACCQRIRLTHFECVCPFVTPKLAALIGIKRAIKFIEGCGKTVPHHFKCGSITTP